MTSPSVHLRCRSVDLVDRLVTVDLNMELPDQARVAAMSHWACARLQELLLAGFAVEPAGGPGEVVQEVGGGVHVGRLYAVRVLALKCDPHPAAKQLTCESGDALVTW